MRNHKRAVGVFVIGLSIGLAACGPDGSGTAHKTQQELIVEASLPELALPDPVIDWQAYVATELVADDCSSAMEILMPASFSGDTLVREFLDAFEEGGSCGPDHWLVASAAEVNATILSNPYVPFAERIFTYDSDAAGLIPSFRSAANRAGGFSPDVAANVREAELVWLRTCEIPMELPHSRYAIIAAIARVTDDPSLENPSWQQRALECTQLALDLGEAYQQADWGDDEIQVQDGWLADITASVTHAARIMYAWQER